MDYKIIISSTPGQLQEDVNEFLKQRPNYKLQGGPFVGPGFIAQALISNQILNG